MKLNINSDIAAFTNTNKFDKAIEAKIPKSDPSNSTNSYSARL